MAEVVLVTDSYGAYYYIDSSSSKDVLTRAQRDENALYIRNYCAAIYPSWTVNAVSAICGNFAHEGIMNPSQWEYGRGMSTKYGFGLGQWTPATKILNYLSGLGLPNYSIQGQMDRVNYESVNPGTQWIATSSYNLSMIEFLSSVESPAWLASAWLYDWERPKNPTSTEGIRQQEAEYYYQLFTGSEPPDPPPVPPEPGIKARMKPCFYHRYKYN